MSDGRSLSWLTLLTLPERIAGLYSQVGHTRESFAAEINVSPERVRRWEHFEDVPTLHELTDAADKLRVSKPVLCFGEARFPLSRRGEPALTDKGMEAALADIEATPNEQQAFQTYRNIVQDATTYSRTFVLMFVRAFRLTLESGIDRDIALTRAMVVATQAHWLSRAVAQGAVPVREHLLTPPPKNFNAAERVEYMAEEIIRISGLKPPIEAHVLAIAMGNRLVPSFGHTAASRVEVARQKRLSNPLTGV